MTDENQMKLEICFEGPRRILIIRRDNIGDLVCTTPAFEALRRHYPNAQIGALVNSYNAEVLKGNPNVDYVFVYKKLKHVCGFYNRFKALIQRLELIITIRSWKPDVVVLAKSSYDRYGLNFARNIGAKNIIGFVPDDIKQTKGLPDIRIKTPIFSTLHEVEAVNLLLAQLGIKDALGNMQVFPDPCMAAKILLKLPDAKLRVAIQISAREPERRWGIENFVALAEFVLQYQQQIQVLLLWSPGTADDPRHPGDDDAAAYVIQTVQNDRLIPMPTQSLTELIAVLSHCSIFIGSDGGAMHLAVALRKKVLAMFENRLEKLNHWYPWKVESVIEHSRSSMEPEISKITPLQMSNSFRALVGDKEFR